MESRSLTHYSFRDGRLRSRPLRMLNRVGRGLAACGVSWPSLSPDSIVTAARKRAGENDMGGDSYREPLERYLQAVRDEAELTCFGRLATRGMLVSALANRIALARWAREHPEIREERIDRPWVIVGLPRTGTSVLSNLLGLDPESRSLLQWEAANPIPPPTLTGASEDPRIAKHAREMATLSRLTPAMAAMYPFGATLAQECVALHLYDVRTLGVETQAYVPSYGRWLQKCDMAPAYTQHRLALQALQSAQPTGHWVLKTPNHLWCLETLRSFYPDARILWTHRDPGTVVSSLASLVNAAQGLFTDRRDPKPAAEEWRAKAHHAIDSGMAFDTAHAGEWCHHIRYADFMRDPIASVRSIYAHFDQEVSPLHERRMRAWLRDRPQHAFGRHLYDPADFGWSYEELAADFRSYRERYNIPRE